MRRFIAVLALALACSPKLDEAEPMSVELNSMGTEFTWSFMDKDEPITIGIEDDTHVHEYALQFGPGVMLKMGTCDSNVECSMNVDGTWIYWAGDEDGTCHTPWERVR